MVALEHVLDSLSLVRVITNHLAAKKIPPRLIDIGSGAGFPGLILAIVLTELHFTLVDSIEKKTFFLNEVSKHLGLDNVDVLNERAEELAHQRRYRDSFGFATARAVGASNITAELALPLLSLDGLLILQKTNAQLEVELHNCENASRLLGGVIESPIALESAVLQKERALILISKQKNTPAKYPRSWKRIKEDPL